VRTIEFKQTTKQAYRCHKQNCYINLPVIIIQIHKFRHRFFKDNIKLRYESHSLNKQKKKGPQKQIRYQKFLLHTFLYFITREPYLYKNENSGF
jgi:predicted DNA binding CopG/RHH family protein